MKWINPGKTNLNNTVCYAETPIGTFRIDHHPDHVGRCPYWVYFDNNLISDRFARINDAKAFSARHMRATAFLRLLVLHRIESIHPNVRGIMQEMATASQSYGYDLIPILRDAVQDHPVPDYYAGEVASCLECFSPNSV